MNPRWTQRNPRLAWLAAVAIVNPSRIASEPPASTDVVASLPGFEDEANAIREQLAMAAAVDLAGTQ